MRNRSIFTTYGTSIALLTTLLVSGSHVARADSVNSPNITMNVDTNRSVGNGAGNVSVTVNTITIAETTLPEYSSGAGAAITLKVKPGFQFDPTSNVTAQSATIGFNGGSVNGVATVVPAGTADEVITFALTSGTNVQVQDIIRINGIKLRIISTAGAAGPAQTTVLLTTSAAGGAFTNQGIIAASIVRGAPDHLQFSAQPGSTQVGGDLLPAVKVVDFGGNLITTGDIFTITLAIQSNPGAGTLSGTTSHQTSGGVATWLAADHLSIAAASAGYTLRASHNLASFLTSDTVDSGGFDILAGAPDHMTITKQPVDTAAGGDLLIDVTVLDNLNNPVATAVNATLDSAINPGGWPLLVDSNLTKATVAGVASWTTADHLRINKAVSGYTLQASGIGSPVQTNAFNITPSVPVLLRFSQQPTDVLQNAAISPPVAVEVDDAFLNLTGSTASIQLALAGDVCSGNVSGNQAAAAAGLATFSAVALDTACDAAQLTASSDGLLSTTSEPFVVSAPGGGQTGNACGTCGAGAAGAIAPLMLAELALRRRRSRKAR